jgi:polysaccharide pyruvyl transferase WcaK-like protein
MDYFTTFWEGIVKIARRVPVCIWGVGYCDIKHEPTLPPQELIEDVIEKSEICAVRDEYTRNRLARFTLPPAVGCPSLCALDTVREPGAGILHVDNYTTVGPAAYDAMEDFAHKVAARHGVPFRKTNNRISAGDDVALDTVLKRYADSEIVLSSALHGCIIGVGMGRKVVAVSGDRKIDSFMNSAGLGQWVCEANEVESLACLWDLLPKQELGQEYVEQSREQNCSIAIQVNDLAVRVSAAVS